MRREGGANGSVRRSAPLVDEKVRGRLREFVAGCAAFVAEAKRA
jgi:hypothetical protein